MGIAWKSLPGFLVLYVSGQIITTSAEVTLNGGLVRESSTHQRCCSQTVRESPQNPFNSGFGIMLNFTYVPRCLVWSSFFQQTSFLSGSINSVFCYICFWVMLIRGDMNIRKTLSLPGYRAFREANFFFFAGGV